MLESHEHWCVECGTHYPHTRPSWQCICPPVCPECRQTMVVQRTAYVMPQAPEEDTPCP